MYQCSWQSYIYNNKKITQLTLNQNFENLINAATFIDKIKAILNILPH